MSNPNVKGGEKVAVAGLLVPATVANTEVFTDVVDVSKYGGVMAIAVLGNMASETIDFKAYRCASDGSSAVALTGYAITQLAAHASNNDSKAVIVSMLSDALMASGAQYVKFGLVTGGATGGPAMAIALGLDARFQPVSHVAAVVQNV